MTLVLDDPRTAAALQDRVHLTVDDVPVALLVARRWTADVRVVDGDWLELRVPDGASVLPGLLAALAAEGVDVRTAEAEGPSLADVAAATRRRRTGW